jgi:hypothetical protein
MNAVTSAWVEVAVKLLDSAFVAGRSAAMRGMLIATKKGKLAARLLAVMIGPVIDIAFGQVFRRKRRRRRVYAR